MTKQEIGLYLQVGGIVLGAVVAVTLVTIHPIPIVLLGIGAGLYFVGDYLKK
jgi:hypothetical protein